MNLRQFDLNLLVALDALLTERNVTRAAERLFLSQPAMSGMLARLRQAFGDELLVRVGRNLELTDFATGIAGQVHASVQELEDLLNARRPFQAAIENRSFRIAASDYAILLLFGPLIRRLEEVAPGISVRFVKLDGSAVERQAAGDIDFVILPAQFEPGLPSLPLFDDSWVCAAWSQHPTLPGELTVEAFLGQPHLTFNFAEPGHPSMADEHLASSGYERRIVASTESFAAAPFLLRGTSLLTLLPRRLGERLQGAADIRLLELPFEVPTLHEKLTWNPRFTSSPGHVWLRELLAGIASSLTAKVDDQRAG
jgi:LysR family transcriptional regulator, nod-box dependent transcriptional activator